MSIRAMFEAHPSIVKFREISTSAIAVEWIKSSIIYVKGKLYTNNRDLPANYWYEADTFEKLMHDAFKNIAHIVYVLSDKLYALVFYQEDGKVSIVAYDVSEAIRM